VGAKDEVDKALADVIDNSWNVRDGKTVPETVDVGYKEAVKLTATFLYSDMANSTGLVKACPKLTAGKVIRLYLNTCVRILHLHDGHVRSFDGDRVMAVFHGDGQAVRSVKAALMFQYAIDEYLRPALSKEFKSIRDSGWKLSHGTGIAKGETYMFRGGVRGNSDLVSVGSAPNLSAKLSDKRGKFRTRIGAGAYGNLDEATLKSKGVNMWQGPYSMDMGGSAYSYYATAYRWSF
jgi:class 3 adenylate cyclase